MSQAVITIDGDTILMGKCEHCGNNLHGKGHADLVGVYQDHLREVHPKMWVKA